MSGVEEKKKGEGKGFAGLSSLVSNVDSQLPPTAKVEPAPTAQSASAPKVKPASSAQAAVRPTPRTSQPTASGQHQTRQEPVQPSSSGGSSDGDGKWMLLILVLVGLLIWVISQSDKNSNPPSSTGAPAMQAPAAYQASAPPKFNDYLSEIYTGQRAKVKLSADFDRIFRTRLRNTQVQPINFAGEYVLTTWGCGTDCLMGAAVSARTGQIIALPGSVCCRNGDGEKIIFRKNSNLLVIVGFVGESGQHGSHFYELKNNSFVHVQTIPVEVGGDEYQDTPPSTSEAESLTPGISPSPAAETTDNSQNQLLPQTNEPYRPAEDKPPVGSNLTLSSEQILYCVAENIRLEGAKAAVDNHSDYEVNRFNVMVSDYNSRCGSFRYRRGSLESAQSDVELRRSQLLSEGRSRFRSQSSGSQSAPTPVTSNAVVPSSYTPHAATQSRQEFARPTSGSIPANAHLNYLGNDWVCDRGYFRHGNECLAVQVPHS